MEKKFKILLCSLFGLGVLITSCKKDEDNSKPETSSQSSNNASIVDTTLLISKVWKIQDHLTDGKASDSSLIAAMSALTIEFTKDGKQIFKENDSVVSQGTWKYLNAKKYIISTMDDDIDTLTISKLTSSQLWIVNNTTISVESNNEYVEKVVPAETRLIVK